MKITSHDIVTKQDDIKKVMQGIMLLPKLVIRTTHPIGSTIDTVRILYYSPKQFDYSS